MPNENGNDNNNENESEMPTFETWVADQGDDVQSLIDDHVAGLKSALKAERDQRKTIEKQLRDAAGELEKGSKAREQLDTIATDLSALERQTAFYESAHGAGISNLRLAWVVVGNDDSLTDASGAVDMKRLRESYPELFATAKNVAGNAGDGTGGKQATSTKSMNDFIRRSAGRTT